MPSLNSGDRMIPGPIEVSLRLILIVPLVLQILAAVGLSGWLSWRSAQKAVRDFASQLMTEATTGVEQYLLAQDLTRLEISELLQNQKILPLGQMAIIEPSGKIVASSLSELPIQTDRTEPEEQPIRVVERETLIPAAIKFLQSDRRLQKINRREQYSFNLNGQGQFLQVTPIADDRGLDWFVLVVIPERELMAPMKTNIRYTILVGIGALGLASSLGLMTAEAISQRIRQFSQASRAIARGNFEPMSSASSVKELASLADDWNQMAGQLQDSFQKLQADAQEWEQLVAEKNKSLEQEIHDRQIVEQQLHTSEKKMRGVFEAMNDIVIVFDTDGNLEISPTNPGVLYEPDIDIIGLTIEHFYQDEKFIDLQEKIQRVLDLQKTLNFDYSFWVDSEERWFSARVSPMSDNSVIWVARDISDRKQTELALHLAQQKSESLLLNILPQTIADKLKESTEAIAEHFDEVSILFSDIVGFTPLSARLSAIELVNLLNYMFSQFDQLAEKYQLEKIKTIGDAYMVAAGLPLHRKDHALAIAEMALDMQEAIHNFSAQHSEDFQIRIGIHSGPVVAGVIGKKKFIYDLWGDTVNVASRMESSAIPSKIQVSADTYELLKDEYILEKRGQISVKGKGEMIAYWLIDRRLDKLESRGQMTSTLN